MTGRYETHAYWTGAGFLVKKGERSHKRNESGTPLFHTNQVKLKSTRPCRYGGRSVRDWDSDPGYSDLGIGDFQ